MSRLIMLLLGVSVLTEAQAFPCYITMVKSTCWSSYNVNANIIDSASEKVLANINMPEGTSWGRQEIDCQPKQTVELQATFSPTIWEKEEGKVYFGKRYWSFPEEIKKDESAWNMTICYPGDFAATPYPPEASGTCPCDTTNIPVIQPR